MAGSIDMKLVRVGSATYKIRPSDLARYMEANPGAQVVGGYESKAEPETESHSDQEIGHVQALIEAIPDLTENQARAIVAAGFTLATLPAKVSELVEIKGIGDATAEKIVEALSE